LKDLVGKDLSKISLPVYFNEPLSILQKAAEAHEYIDLLERAAKEPHQYKRFALVAAFNGTRMNYIRDRTLKPFNPLLGETYELVTADQRFIAEQVCHHPPVTAFHCDSAYYEQYSCQSNSASFNGRYITISPKNRNYVTLKLPGGALEHYSWNAPQSTIHNLLIGKMYIEVRGKTRIINHTTGDICDMEWKERGWSGKPFRIEGTVKSASGEPRYKMHGIFTE
jgi:hypothetical protein